MNRAGLEPATTTFEAWDSDPLSYRFTMQFREISRMKKRRTRSESGRALRRSWEKKITLIFRLAALEVAELSDYLQISSSLERIWLEGIFVATLTGIEPVFPERQSSIVNHWITRSCWLTRQGSNLRRSD